MNGSSLTWSQQRRIIHFQPSRKLNSRKTPLPFLSSDKQKNVALQFMKIESKICLKPEGWFWNGGETSHVHAVPTCMISYGPSAPTWMPVFGIVLCINKDRKTTPISHFCFSLHQHISLYPCTTTKSYSILLECNKMPGWLKHTGAFPSCDILPLTITNFRSHLWLLPFITNFFASGSFLQLWEQFAPPLSCFACGSDTSSRTSREKTGEDVFWKKTRHLLINFTNRLCAHSM